MKVLRQHILECIRNSQILVKPFPLHRCIILLPEMHLFVERQYIQSLQVSGIDTEFIVREQLVHLIHYLRKDTRVVCQESDTINSHITKLI